MSLAEREATEADHVERLRWFLKELHWRTKKRIVICIDELDKMDQSDDVVAVINGVKDLFHLPGVHVLVSVSTDAMHAFAARGVLVRDVFDSAFDFVLQVQRLSTEESRELLWRRATRFSAPAALFCHVWAGGHPRDLIRTARSCVTLRAQKKDTLALAAIVDAVVLSDVRDLLAAAAERIHGEGVGGPGADDDAASEVLALRELLVEEAPGPLHERIRSALQICNLPAIQHGVSESSIILRALDPYLRFAACVSLLFSFDLTREDWSGARAIKLLQLLVDTQTALSRRPSDAVRAVGRAEQALAGLISFVN